MASEDELPLWQSSGMRMIELSDGFGDQTFVSTWSPGWQPSWRLPAPGGGRGERRGSRLERAAWVTGRVTAFPGGPRESGRTAYFPHVLGNGISWDVTGSLKRSRSERAAVLAQARWRGFRWNHRISVDIRWSEVSAGMRWENLRPRRYSWKDYKGGWMSSPRLYEHPRNAMQPHRRGLLRSNWENESNWAFLALTLLSFCYWQ